MALTFDPPVLFALTICDPEEEIEKKNCTFYTETHLLCQLNAFPVYVLKPSYSHTNMIRPDS